MHKRWYNWIRSGKRRNAAVSEEDTMTGLCSSRGKCMEQALMFERIPLQEFNGKLKNWADFRRLFKEMMKESGQGQVLKMARLTSTIHKEDREIVEGIAEPEEAWENLDDTYGDRKLTIIAAMSNLMQLKLPAGLAHKKVEASDVIGL